MTHRRRTILRLAVPAAFAAVGVTALVTWRAGAVEQREAFIEQRLTSGEAAFIRGNWQEAALLLEARPGEPATVRRALQHAEAVARYNPPTVGGLHALQLLRDLDPTDASERRQWYTQQMAAGMAAGLPQRTLDLADAARAENIENLEVLRQRRDAMAALGRFDAVDAAELVLQTSDSFADVVDLLAYAELLEEDDALAFATDLNATAQSTGRGQARALLVLAEANRRVGRVEQAAACLDQAAAVVVGERGVQLATSTQNDDWYTPPATPAQPPAAQQPDEQAVDVLSVVAALDAEGRFVEADDVLRTCAEAPSAPLAVRTAASVRAALEDHPAESRSLLASSSESTVGLYGPLVLLGDMADMHPSLETESPRAWRAWQAIATCRSVEATAVQRLEASSSGLSRVTKLPGRPLEPVGTQEVDLVPAAVLHVEAATAAQALEEPDLARRHLEAAATASPAWAEPWLLRAELALAHDRLDVAGEAIDQATLRENGIASDRLARSRAKLAYERWRAEPTPIRLSTATALMQTVNGTDLPGERLRLLHVDDPTAAKALLASIDRLSPSDQLAIILAADAVGLKWKSLPAGLEDSEALFLAAQLVRERHGVDAALAWLEQSGNNNALAAARMLERAGDSRALERWQAVVESPDRPAKDWLVMLDEGDSLRGTVQGAALLQQATLELQTVTEPVAQLLHRPRLEDARLSLDLALLASGPERERLTHNAAIKLKRLAARRDGQLDADAAQMLARALVNLGHFDAAKPHVLAVLSDPATEADQVLELLQMLDRIGDRDAIRDVHARLAADGLPAAEPAVCVEIARRLADGGQADAAVAMLRKAELDSASHLVLIESLRRSGRALEADVLLATLLDDDAVDSAVLLEAAAVMPSIRDLLLERVLNRLSEPADVAVIRGTLAGRTGRPGDAAGHFAAVAGLQPTFEAPWREAIGYFLSREDASSAARLAAMVDAVDLAEPRLRRMVAVALAAPSSGDDADRVVAVSRRISDRELTRVALLPMSDRTAADLGVLEMAAESLPYFPPIHRLLHASYVHLGRPDEAARVAARAAANAPLSPDLQRLGYAATRAIGDTAGSAFFANRWRQTLDFEDPIAMYADTAVADALVLRGRYDEALAVIEPRLDDALADAGTFGHLLSLAAESLAAVGMPNRARQIIAPQLGRDDAGGAGWRRLAARLAADTIGDSNDARGWLTLLDYHIERLPIGPDRLSDEVDAAVAWGRLGVRLDDAEAIRTARRRLTRLTSGGLAGADVELLRRSWAALARVDASDGRTTDAEAAWRRLLTLSPRDPVAANQLAHLLLTQHVEPLTSRELEEVVAFADLAVELQPETAAHHDTQARARLAAGQPIESARTAFERALRLDESYIDAMLGLASLELTASLDVPPPVLDDGDWPLDVTTTRQAAARREAAVASRNKALELYRQLRPIYLTSARTTPHEPHLAAEFRRLAAAFDGESADGR